MLAFVTAEEASLEDFLSVSKASTYQEQLREYLDSLLRQRCTRPAWCVVALDSGVPVARAALWSLPDKELPTDLVLIHPDWVDAELATAQALLARVHELAASLGADGLSHSVDSPPAAPQYQEDEDARIRLLESSGYHLLRDGLRWRFSPEVPERSEAAPPLVFRALPEIGEDEFVEAIASTYQGTRDTWIAHEIEQRGLLGAARADFVGCQELEYRPEWWELAYTEDGALAGVIMAGRNPGSAVIAYVGVVPEQRGRGLGQHLVRRGTELLVAGGADEIRGDCDRDNVGMVKAFQRAGYDEFARRRTYRYELRG